MKRYFATGFSLLLFVSIIFYSCSSESTDSDDTSVDLPTVTTMVVSAINQTTATSGGEVLTDGGGTITTRGVCWSTSSNPTTADNKTTQEGTLGVFSSSLTELTANTAYYVRAYAVNSAGTAYGQEITFTTTMEEIDLPEVSTTEVTELTQTSASVGGNVTSEGGATVTERGIAWATTQNPTLTDNVVVVAGTTGSFTGNITGLTVNTTYYVRAYATNNGGTAYGEQINFTTPDETIPGPTGGSAVCDGTQPTQVVTITSTTGKIWMDRNLGASRAATSSKDFEAYGCLYQWGRGNDGHASITWTMGEPDGWGGQPGTAVNGTTATRSNSDNPGHALFIRNENMPYDWRTPKNDNLWQGVDGINNPCPTGYRVPTRAEFQAEISAYSITSPTAAYNSAHKFPLAGDRAFDSGSVRDQGKEAWFWTSTTGNTGRSYNVSIIPGAVYTNVDNGRAGGYSVRCIKD